MAHFDEQSGIVPCVTEWGRWWQTIQEVYIEVSTGQTLKARDIVCDIQPRRISLTICGRSIFQGTLFEPVHADEAIWTLEDKTRVFICLTKVHATAAHCWRSLMVDLYPADPLTLDDMQKKLTLQRFQMENPGMDFSKAALSGNYQSGGPELPS